LSLFRKVLAYASSNKCDDARLKLGLCCMKLGRRSEARSHFEALIRDYPSSEYAGRARTYLEQL
jgi:TolA-binding protein